MRLSAVVSCVCVGLRTCTHSYSRNVDKIYNYTLPYEF